MKRLRTSARTLGFICAASMLGGCSGWQSALDPKGPEAQHLADLIRLFTTLCTAIWVFVMLALLVGLLRQHRPRPEPLALNPPRERRTMAVVVGLTIATALVVLTLSALSYASQRKLYAKEPAGLEILVIGHQWWWELRYQDQRPDRTFTTANEMHIPVGTPVRLKLQSSDVIHSFWAPSLAGKMDLIPGQENELQFTASRPGVYRGQCAEFCGWQHAHMGLLVHARPKEEFEAWRADQIKPAETPSEPERQRGQDLFLSKACVMCHTIRGTLAGGKVAPELTHVASRRYLAAATLPMSRGNIAAWIVDPQGIKPGANMPLTRIEPDELDPLVSYLAGLR